MSIEILATETLAGCKIGFYIPSCGKIYVCPTVKSLIDSDYESMMHSLECITMPKNLDGTDKFSSLDLWILDAIETGKYDIFK